MTAAVEVNRQRLVEFCRTNSVRRLALFGSVLTERFSESSDVDVLVEFEPDTHVGTFEWPPWNASFHKCSAAERSTSERRVNSAAISATKFFVLPPFNMPPSDLIRLRHMLEASREAAAFALGKDRENIKQDRVLMLAAVRCIEIVGEAASRISSEMRLE